MKKKIRKILIIGAVILVVGMLVSILVRNKQIAEARVYHSDPDRAVLVETDTVQMQKLNIMHQYVGTLKPTRKVTISAEVQGKIVTVGVKEGELIHSGTLVAQMDDDYEQAKLLAAKAAFNNAQRKFHRYEGASSGEGISQMKVDNARTEMQTAKAKVEQLKVQIDRSHITAPFSGIITKRFVDPGATVGFGSSIATLLDLSVLELVVTVSQEEIGNFEEGQSLKVYSSIYPDTIFAGTVTVVSASGDASHKFEVKIQVANHQHKLRAGMFGKIIPVQTLDSLFVIPRVALIGQSQNPQVYVVRDSIARLQDIEIGYSNDRLIGVTNGLKKRDVIVTKGQINITNGTKVKVHNP